MKISIAWVLDHLTIAPNQVNITHLVNTFNTSVAEIEQVRPITLFQESFAYGQVIHCDGATASIELVDGGTLDLPLRPDVKVKKNSWYVLYNNGQQWNWATLQSFNPESRSIDLPEIALADVKNWKNYIDWTDHLLVIDNKSITHRPDLWSHRGIARECAIILQCALRPLEKMSKRWAVERTEQLSAPIESDPSYSLTIESSNACSRYACGQIRLNNNPSSSLFVAQRLARLDARSINAVIDATNYVMYDVGQPLHAFDASTINKKLVVRYARPQETVTLLDITKIILNKPDIVIADENKVCALAGISGAQNTGVKTDTTHILVEAAHFTPTLVRRTAAATKVRTQAAMRFEKNIDPDGVTPALRRFLAVLTLSGVSYKLISSITEIGPSLDPVIITVTHEFIEKRLGCSLPSKQVKNILTALGFKVRFKKETYTIEVPSFRRTKDIGVPEDIVEEVGRIIGYNTIEPVPARRAMVPFDLHVMQKKRALKNFFAFGAYMHEVYNYGLYDESFLSQLQWQPQESIEIANPLSENWRRLVTSLIPHLIKVIVVNHDKKDKLRFFEMASTWFLETPQPIEKKEIAGIIYDRHVPIDFYVGKQLITDMANALDLPSLDWQPFVNEQKPWYEPHKSASLFYKGVCVGYAGILNAAFVAPVLSGKGFIFELDAQWILHYKPHIERYRPLFKFPAVTRDVSVIMPYTHTVATCINTIKSIDAQIVEVELIDVFEKKEWKESRALTYRLTVRNAHKTLTTSEIDDIYTRVVHALQLQGGVIR